MEELIIPPLVKEDPQAFELLRVWAANGEQHVTIHSELNGKAFDFGTMLFQLAEHGANLYSERFQVSFDEALKEILKGFDDESEGRHSEVLGEILK